MSWSILYNVPYKCEDYPWISLALSLPYTAVCVRESRGQWKIRFRSTSKFHNLFVLMSDVHPTKHKGLIDTHVEHSQFFKRFCVVGATYVPNLLTCHTCQKVQPRSNTWMMLHLRTNHRRRWTVLWLVTYTCPSCTYTNAPTHAPW